MVDLTYIVEPSLPAIAKAVDHLASYVLYEGHLIVLAHCISVPFCIYSDPTIDCYFCTLSISIRMLE